MRTKTEKTQKTKKNNSAKPNRTGIPMQMKQNCEKLSGLSFDDVRVHYHSEKPLQLAALAYTKGNDVYLGPGQEKYLGHELGHVIQQKQGRVKPTGMLKMQAINDDRRLEAEADRIGQVIQCRTDIHYTTQDYPYHEHAGGNQFYLQTTNAEVGHVTTAHLEPDDPRNGSSPSGMDDLMQNLRLRFNITDSGNLVRGHLLNHDLGGLGCYFNMFPISGEANHLHSIHVEETVKAMLYDGNCVDYTIEAVNNNAGLQVGNEDKCEDDIFHITVITKGGKQEAILYSNIWNEKGSMEGTISYINNDSVNRRINWKHKGSGLRNEIEMRKSDDNTLLISAQQDEAEKCYGVIDHMPAAEACWDA